MKTERAGAATKRARVAPAKDVASLARSKYRAGTLLASYAPYMRSMPQQCVPATAYMRLE